MQINPKDKELINEFIPTTIQNLTDTSEHYGDVDSDTNPAFYGSYDWHSSVHSHWQVIRALRCNSDAPYVDSAVNVLDHHLTEEKIKKETENVPSQEVPYGISWVLLLAQELHEWDQDIPNMKHRDKVKRWLSAIEPLETYAGEAIEKYIKETHKPNRGGDHDQTALPLTLALDWARAKGNGSLIDQIEAYATEHYTKHIEKPTPDLGRDFLSPSLAEADLLRHVLKQDEFTNWVNESYFSGNIENSGTYAFIKPPTGNLYHHAYGLNISRACMAQGIASALKEEAYRTFLLKIANESYNKGLKPALNKNIGVSHWVPTYIMYYVTNRGIYGD